MACRHVIRPRQPYAFKFFEPIKIRFAFQFVSFSATISSRNSVLKKGSINGINKNKSRYS